MTMFRKAIDSRGPRLPRDLAILQRQLYGRRHVMGWLTGGAITALAGSDAAMAATAAMCTAAPEETNGPFPADGASSASGRTLNILNRSGIVRRDITRSFGSSTTVAAGVPLELIITLEAASGACQPLPGHAVYVWHCDRNGDYSMYARPIVGENYLRGVQVGDGAGQVTFQTIFPACYAGRYPHIHVEVYPSLAVASAQTHALLTSQLALPREACARVYTEGAGYHESLHHMAGLSASSDNVFEDSTAAQLAAQTPVLRGSAAMGFSATVVVAVRPG